MKVLSWLFNIFIIFCSALLLCDAKFSAILNSLTISILIGIVISLLRVDLFSQKWIHKKFLLTDISILFIVSESFICRWIVSSKVANVAARLHVSTNTLLFICSMILGVLALKLIDYVISHISDLIEKISGKGKEYHWLASICLIAFMLIGQLLMLQNSSLYPVFPILASSVFKGLLNFFVLFILNIVISFLCRSYKNGITVSSVVIFLWSIVNYYVVEFHGAPLYFSELINFKTAAAVALSYKLDFSIVIVTNTLILCAIMYTVRNHQIFKENSALNKYDYVFAVFSLILCCFGTNLYLNQSWFFDSWRDSIRYDGFTLCLIRDAALRTEIAIKPEVYDSSSLIYDNPKISENTEYPDIILILNESFCDLDYYSDLATDSDYLKDFYSIENAIFGYALSPGVGGGTNNSEFELLTSKSMNIVTGTAPFTYLNNELISRSVVHYAKQLGYYTTGMHNGGAANYSRNTAYPALGFDEIYLGPEKFKYISDNGNRSWTDIDNYKDLIDHYEEQDSESPKFMYLLTFQNHGGYDQNDESFDTVHTTKDFGDLTDDVNEYISSVKLSAEAIKYLTDYFRNKSRPVIICMVGDHTVSFVDKLPGNERNSHIDEGFTQRVVPYMLWSNYGANFDHDYYEYTSMTDLVPMILDAADVPMSSFYRTVMSLHEQYPVRAKNGLVMDHEGNITSYDPEKQEQRKIVEYYCLEYNSLLTGDEYKEEIFNVPK